MCPQDQPEPEQATKSTETSPDSSSKWGQVTVGRFSPSMAYMEFTKFISLRGS
jgi:hypothetical protein